MRKLILSAACLMVPAIAIQATAADQRIHFKRGAISSQVSGSLSGPNSEVCFVAGARAGQQMRVNVNGAGPTRGTVKFPSGGGDGQPGGLIYDDTLPETGDYRICVTESQMANPWNGKFTVDVVIK